MSDEPTKQCQACGATIYQEHLDSGIAGYLQGALLCPHCRQERTKAGASATAAMERELDTIALVDEEAPHSVATAVPASTRKPVEPQHAQSALDAGLRRPLISEGPYATRCRTFHAKLNEGAVAYMNRQINEWADADDDIHIKFASSCIGVYEGKHTDPHLIVTLFY